ncbi:MAG: hypothetical protein H6855_01490 [Rhodospirillales bacterium]|nr:hypothetical protein [Rhodospirillales bacterium]MCB9964743.1 hypothetical protein [Rhodospirillales bacterium]
MPELLGRDNVAVVDTQTSDSVKVGGADYNFNPYEGTLDRTFKGLFNDLPSADPNFQIQSPKMNAPQVDLQETSALPSFDGRYANYVGNPNLLAENAGSIVVADRLQEQAQRNIAKATTTSSEIDYSRTSPDPDTSAKFSTGMLSS